MAEDPSDQGDWPQTELGQHSAIEPACSMNPCVVLEISEHFLHSDSALARYLQPTIYKTSGDPGAMFRSAMQRHASTINLLKWVPVGLFVSEHVVSLATIDGR